jgi:hypothetical protein
MYFQIFKKKPDNDLILKILNIYGIDDINNIDKNYTFTLEDLKKLNVIQKLKNLDELLKDYYLECKYKIYINNLNEKKSLTVLRHFLKLIDYKINYTKKCEFYNKYLLYKIEKNTNLNKIKKMNKTNKKQKKIQCELIFKKKIISFD